MFDLRFCDGLCIFYTQGLINWKLNFYLCDICSLEHDAIASIGGGGEYRLFRGSRGSHEHHSNSDTGVINVR